MIENKASFIQGSFNMLKAKVSPEASDEKSQPMSGHSLVSTIDGIYLDVDTVHKQYNSHK